MPNEATFGSTIKAWFRANNWPQSVPEKLAKAKGNPTGPWASQISHAMNDKHQPKTEFFMAMAWFNEVVATRDFSGLSDRRLVDQLRNAQPLCHDNGQPYTAPDFFSLFTGLIDPPAEFAAGAEPELTLEDVEEATRLWRISFREISMKHMCSKAEAWEMLKERMMDYAAEDGFGRNDQNDCLSWVQEVLAGIKEPTVEEAIRQAKRWKGSQPLQRAMEELLGEKKLSPTVLDERPSEANQNLFPSLSS
jgi:hypothetical protein